MTRIGLTYQSCFVSPGNQLGAVAGNCIDVTVVEAFMEESDVNAYDIQSYPLGQISLETTDFYTAFYTNECNGSAGSDDPYVYNG